MPHHDPDLEYKGPLPDHLRDVLLHANLVIDQGGEVHFKWTCHHCRARQTFPTPNSFYIKGLCEECGHVTDLFKPDAKINYVVIFRGVGHG